MSDRVTPVGRYIFAVEPLDWQERRRAWFRADFPGLTGSIKVYGFGRTVVMVLPRSPKAPRRRQLSPSSLTRTSHLRG